MTERETDATARAEEAGDGAAIRQRVAGASGWTIGFMGGASFLRLASQVVLAQLLLPEHFGLIALLRVSLVVVEQLSEVGIRGAVVYHERGQSKEFLDTAWTLQIVRGFAVWVLACGLAWPIALFYGEPLLLWLLPVAGFEAVNNGFASVALLARQRSLRLKLPYVLEWSSLVVSVLVTLLWAWLSPSVWALVAGPLAGGLVKTVASHVLTPETRLRLRWERDSVHALVHFGKWVYAGTLAALVAQQFLTLYLGKLVPLALLGVYRVAWNFTVHASKPLTMLANQVVIPLLAEYGRSQRESYSERVAASLRRYLPTCLLVCVCTAISCPALFGYFFPAAFADGGTMGRYLAVVVWFMILQHVPRSALLALGSSKGVFQMTAWNAGVTIAGCVLGYQLGSIRGAILGNALGNVAGCLCGVWVSRGMALGIGRPMLGYSLAFVALAFGGSAAGDAAHAAFPEITRPLASLVMTIVVGLPLGLWVWGRTARPFLASRRARSEVLTP